MFTTISRIAKKPMIMFLLGILSVVLIATLIPENISANSLNIPLQTQETRERPSPQDYIQDSQIHVYKEKVVIDVKNVKWAEFADTNSMLPVIDKGANALQIEPKCPEEIKLGDIVSYKSKYSTGTIIHRVVYAGEDENGIYFILKGDNNPSNDPGKIRCDQIERKVIGILY